MSRLRFSPVLFFSSVLLAIIASLSWLTRAWLFSFAAMHPAFFTAVALGTSLLCLMFALVLVLESRALQRTWLDRTAAFTGLESLKPRGTLATIAAIIPDPFETLSQPLFRNAAGRRLRDEWIDAELGEKASRYLLILVLSAAGGYLLGMRVGGLLLALALFIFVPFLPRALVRSRAENRRRRFGEQLPQVLEGLASGLSAGLSFEGAVGYVLSDLPQPSKATFTRLSRRLGLGTPIPDALTRLQAEAQDESLSLAVDGLILQRQFGGDVVQMLEETGALLRERLELEREVRAITTQGRLSGVVIAALVPVSAGFLLSFNPRYIDVLFDNLIGQAMVILALALQLVGWAIISRLVRIRY